VVGVDVNRMPTTKRGEMDDMNHVSVPPYGGNVA
jgi:hypothetical protein